MRTLNCDLCGQQCSATDGPDEHERYDESREYGLFQIIVKRRFWDGAPFGFVTERLNVCCRCIDKIVHGIKQKRSNQ